MKRRTLLKSLVGAVGGLCGFRFARANLPEPPFTIHSQWYQEWPEERTADGGIVIPAEFNGYMNQEMAKARQ